MGGYHLFDCCVCAVSRDFARNTFRALITAVYRNTNTLISVLSPSSYSYYEYRDRETPEEGVCCILRHVKDENVVCSDNPFGDMYISYTTGETPAPERALRQIDSVESGRV